MLEVILCSRTRPSILSSPAEADLGAQMFHLDRGPKGAWKPEGILAASLEAAAQRERRGRSQTHSKRDMGQIPTTRTAWAESTSAWTAPGSDW